MTESIKQHEAVRSNHELKMAMLKWWGTRAFHLYIGHCVMFAAVIAGYHYHFAMKVDLPTLANHVSLACFTVSGAFFGLFPVFIRPLARAALCIARIMNRRGTGGPCSGSGGSSCSGNAKRGSKISSALTGIIACASAVSCHANADALLKRADDESNKILDILTESIDQLIAKLAAIAFPNANCPVPALAFCHGGAYGRGGAFGHKTQGGGSFGCSDPWDRGGPYG